MIKKQYIIKNAKDATYELSAGYGSHGRLHVGLTIKDDLDWTDVICASILSKAHILFVEV